MDSTILNNTTVYAINCNEIYNYSPKRKIEVINSNNNLSPYDKNFTYLVTVHPISPYSQDQTDTFHLSANDVKCTNNNFVDTNDYHYLNNDAFEQWNDSTDSLFPILNYDTTCLYDNSSLNTGDFLNCFSLFIYKKQLHQVINDNTSYPALVHCKINLDDIELQHHKYYHIILTRNDNIYTMHLILDKYSLFSTYDPEHIFRLSQDRHNVSACKVPSDVTTIEAVIDTTTTVSLDKEYNIEFTNDNNSTCIEFEIHETSDVVIEILPDERNKVMSCNVAEHYSPLESKSYGGVGLNTYNYESVYNIDTITDENGNNITRNYEDGRFPQFLNLAPGKYRFYPSFGFTYTNYPDVAFQEYNFYNNNTDYDSFINKPENVSFKIYSSNNYYNAFFDQDYNYKTDTVILSENINISQIVNDDKLVYGYLERFPKNINNNNLLYKNSFKGYITESSFYRDQVYLRKFNNIIPFNSFQYITDYTASYNQDLNQSVYIRPDFQNIIDNPDTETPFSNQNDMKSLIINENKIPLKSYFNIIENNDYQTSWNVNYAGEGNQQGDEEDHTKPRVEYFINPVIDDIILIDENVVNTDIINNVSNKITHIEYPRNIDSSSNIEYTGNNININNKTFCIFTFDIMKNIVSSNGYTVHDQVKFLMKDNYILEEYNENKTYQEYIDSTINYIQPIDLSINSFKKQDILDSLNSYVDTIADSTNNLSIIKFVINCFRDSRYMFIYKITKKTILNDRINYNEYQLSGRGITTSSLFNPVFDTIAEPYHVNFDYRITPSSSTLKGYYTTRKPAKQSGFIGNHYLYQGFYYSTETWEGSNSIIFLYSNDLYDDEFNPVPLEKVYKLTTPSPITMSQMQIELSDLDYNQIRIIDLEGNIYLIMDKSEYISKYGNLLSMFLESELYSDGTVLLDFPYNPNKHYYIDLYDSTSNENIIVNDFWHYQGATKTRIPNYEISEIDSTTYKIDYTNINSDNIGLYIKLDFIEPISNESKLQQALSLFEHGHNFELDNGYCHTLPAIKTDGKKDMFQLKYEELFNNYQSLYWQYARVDHTIVGQQGSNRDNSHMHNLLDYSNYEIASAYVGYYDNEYNEYVISKYTNYDDIEYFFSKINITYDNDKRIIRDF